MILSMQLSALIRFIITRKNKLRTLKDLLKKNLIRYNYIIEYTLLDCIALFKCNLNNFNLFKTPLSHYFLPILFLYTHAKP